MMVPTQLSNTPLRQEPPYKLHKDHCGKLKRSFYFAMSGHALIDHDPLSCMFVSNRIAQSGEAMNESDMRHLS
jgi:hypothetical protein